jgi:hypothetical protein
VEAQKWPNVDSTFTVRTGVQSRRGCLSKTKGKLKSRHGGSNQEPRTQTGSNRHKTPSMKPPLEDQKRKDQQREARLKSHKINIKQAKSDVNGIVFLRKPFLCAFSYSPVERSVTKMLRI